MRVTSGFKIQTVRAIGLLLLMLVGGSLAPATAQSAETRDYTSIIGGARVIGGGPSSIGQFPSVVAVVRDGFSSPASRQFCGATVIAERWVMTAAHCLYDSLNVQLVPSSMRVIAGVTDLRAEQAEEETMVVNVIVHPGYEHAAQTAYDDIALLELATPLSVPPVILRSERDELLGTADGVVVGWGATAYVSPVQAIYPDALQYATVPLVTRETCNAPTSYDGYVGQGQICAGFEAGGVDSCVGDSGGPLFVDTGERVEQVGVVSYGRGCAEAGFYGIYTSVSAYLNWIADYIELPEGVEPLSPLDNQTRGGETPFIAPTTFDPIGESSSGSSDSSSAEPSGGNGSGDWYGSAGPVALLVLGLGVIRRRSAKRRRWLMTPTLVELVASQRNSERI